MTETKDPNEIFRESLANLPAQVEARPPVIQRMEVWPYPELDKLWIRLETSGFVAFPNLGFTLYDPEGQVVSTMFLVEIRNPYQSLTMHLRRPPREGESYRLEVELTRDDQELDARTVMVELVYHDPAEARKRQGEQE